jgi:hypothetical protein
MTEKEKKTGITPLLEGAITAQVIIEIEVIIIPPALVVMVIDEVTILGVVGEKCVSFALRN